MNALMTTALVAGAAWTQRLPGPTIESPEEGSPGFAGFVATFLLAVAIIALAVSFTRRMRRADHRERARAADGEVAADGAAPAPAAADGTGVAASDTGGTGTGGPAAGPGPVADDTTAGRDPR